MKNERPIEVLEEEGNEFREGEEMKEVGEEEEDLGRDDEFGAENEVRDGEESGEQEEEIDHLSALPDDLLIHILSFLGVKRAAITSVLSKRWRFIWVELPNLELFDRHVHGGRTPQFVAWVDRIIAVRSSENLENFDLNMRHGHSFASNIDAWVEFAVKIKAKEVTLRMHSNEYFYTLPEMLCTSSSLKKLSLCEDALWLLERTIEWKSLVSLYILDMELPQHLLDQILSGCPVLSMFDLRQCWGFNCMNINSPSLLKLRIHGSGEGNNGPIKISAPYIRCLDIWLYTQETKLLLTNIRSVHEASIELGYDWEGTSLRMRKGMQKNLLKRLSMSRNLKWDAIALRFSRCWWQRGWQFPQSRRVSLTVSVFLNDARSIPGMIRLLESSPDLETLVVHRCGVRNEKAEWKAPARDDLNCDLLHLKTVKIEIAAEPILGGEPMLTLARILLKRATALEEMLLLIDVEDTDVLLKIGRAFLDYPRSSVKAVVVVPVPNSFIFF